MPNDVNDTNDAIDEGQQRAQALIFVGVKMATTTELLAEHLGLEEGDGAIDALVEAGLLRQNARGKVMLTAEGKTARTEWQETERASGTVEALRAVYQDFLPINAQFLDWMNRWQVREDRGGVPNDHSDARYDRRLLNQLAEIHTPAQAVLEAASLHVPRYSYYQKALLRAHLRVDAGAIEYVADPLRLSYHQTWFEMHQDWLDTLGLGRDA